MPRSTWERDSRRQICDRLLSEVLPCTSVESATFDQLAEELLELHLSMRGKHPDTMSMELIEIAGIAINMLVGRPGGEVDEGFAEWTERHGEGKDE